MTNPMNTNQMNDMLDAISALKTRDECKKFLRDLCTLKELKSMAERWQVVKQLQKDISYRKIAKNTGSSTTTITRVAHFLHHGTGGYQLMLKRLKIAHVA